LDAVDFGWHVSLLSEMFPVSLTQWPVGQTASRTEISGGAGKYIRPAKQWRSPAKVPGPGAFTMPVPLFAGYEWSFMKITFRPAPVPIQLTAVLAIGALLCCSSAYAQGQVTSHCTATERTFISAKMQKVHTSKAGTTFSPTGKVLSICINPQGQTITQMTYRYGMPGNVEFEQSASTTSRFAIFTRSTTPHTGENIISFNKGNFHYYVSESLGMGSGVSLVVFANGKRITDLFSGNNQGADFYSLQDEFDFDAIKSPVLVRKAPVDHLE
jgi:hypothetical protein